jgi:hypothetical protein
MDILGVCGGISMTKVDKIKSQLKKEMQLLSERMNSLMAWKASGYMNSPCMEHLWKPTGMSRSDDNMTLYEKSVCDTCGMTKRTDYKIHNETLQDAWAEFRDIEEE